MHKFKIGKYYRSPLGDIVKCIDWSPVSVVWQTSKMDFFVSTYSEGMKYQFLPDCDSFDEEQFPQWYTLADRKWFCNPWCIKRISRDRCIRYELENDVTTNEEQYWYKKAVCWELVTEEEAMRCVQPIKKIRTNLFFDKENGVVIQADKMPDDRFTQLKFDAEGVYYSNTTGVDSEG